MALSRNGQPRRRPKTILLATTAPQSTNFYRSLATALIAEGWHVNVVSSEGPGLLALGGLGCTVHPLDMERDPRPISDLRSLARWIRLIRRLNPTVAMVGTPKAAFLGSIAAFVNRTPIRIYHVRGLRYETTNGLKRRTLVTMERLTARASTHVLSVSSSVARALTEERITPASKLRVLGHGSSTGVDSIKFRPDAVDTNTVDKYKTALGLRHDRTTVGFVGRLHRDKGVPVLIEAISRLERQQAGRFQLLLIGSQEDEQLSHDVNFPIYHVDQVADVRPYYRLMDVFCLPTLREGFPNVCLEAAAMALPIVTTDATGAVDSVLPGETGFIARASDPATLAAAIAQLAQHPDRARSMGAAGRQWVKRHFEQSYVTHAHVEYLEQALLSLEIPSERVAPRDTDGGRRPCES